MCHGPELHFVWEGTDLFCGKQQKMMDTFQKQCNAKYNLPVPGPFRNDF
jgi:hypothetical protein